ncbi:unnamed protein product [Cyclocybe aegerita]|uniref:F-box domain-containing protein n=1 Tax=Cyclocybe aegerita TaxID=1973307 RepID=A0A8S0XWI1_CYCAE|nr:unnamed protein product [Cyclocybe aegerita]
MAMPLFFLDCHLAFVYNHVLNTHHPQPLRKFYGIEQVCRIACATLLIWLLEATAPASTMRPLSTPDLPYDIWLHIASFLPLSQLKTLYPINSALLGIALDARYRTGFVGPLAHPDTKRALARLTDLFVARRVRTFIFKPGDLCKLLHESKSEELYECKLVDAFSGMRISQPSARPHTRIRNHTPNTPLRTSSPSRAHTLQHYQPPQAATPLLSASEAHKRVMSIMRSMTGLAELHIEIPCKDHWYFADSEAADGGVPALFAKGWQAFGKSLRVLELRVPLEDLALVLPAPCSGVVLECLERVSLRVVRASLTANEETVLRSTVLPFLQTSRHSLRSLALDVQEHTNLSPFLSSLALLPTRMRSLSSFSLAQPFVSTDQTDFSGLHGFLLAHSEHLTSLSLKMNATFTHHATPEAFFSHKSFALALPVLQHLSIHLAHFPVGYADGMIPYIHQFAQTLVSLTLQGQFWPDHRVVAFVDSGFGLGSRLRELQMAVATFSPPLLSAFAEHLPILESLDLDFKDISPPSYIAGFGSPFSVLMSQLSFPDWRLRKFNLKPLDATNSVRKLCKAALVDALPGVLLFCGRNREEYMSTADLI